MGLCASASSEGDVHSKDGGRQGKKYRSPSRLHNLHHGEMSSWPSEEARKRRKPGEFVVFLHNACNVPNMDDLSLSDCYVNMSITDAEGQEVSPIFRSMVRQDSLKPTWNAYIAFPIRPQEEDVLHISLLDHDDIVRDDAIGITRIGIKDLRKHILGEPVLLDLDRSTSTQAPDPTKPTTISLSCMGAAQGPVKRAEKDAAFAVEKEFFLIRHGESKWNEGEKTLNCGLMLGVDHALNQTGVEQAVSFNAKWKDFERNRNDVPNARLRNLQSAFLAAERVFSSPLTRALETALLACQDHKALDPSRGGQELTLLRNLREKKNGAMSFDTVGKATGQKIMVRVREELLKTPGISSQTVDVVTSPSIGFNDCDSMWWTSAKRHDTSSRLAMRFNELWKTLKYVKERNAILVGHSLFFREMQRRCLGPNFKQKNPELSKCLLEKKLNNAACLYIKVRFPKVVSGVSLKPEIVDACLLFGSRFKEEHESDEANQYELSIPS